MGALHDRLPTAASSTSVATVWRLVQPTAGLGLYAALTRDGDRGPRASIITTIPASTLAAALSTTALSATTVAASSLAASSLATTTITPTLATATFAAALASAALTTAALTAAAPARGRHRWPPAAQFHHQRAA